MSLALAVIPVPPITFNVIAAPIEPLVIPVPAVTPVTVPALEVQPASLLNILNGIVDICVLLVVVLSTTTKSSVPTKVPEAANSFKSKERVIVVLPA